MYKEPQASQRGIFQPNPRRQYQPRMRPLSKPPIPLTNLLVMEILELREMMGLGIDIKEQIVVYWVYVPRLRLTCNASLTETSLEFGGQCCNWRKAK